MVTSPAPPLKFRTVSFPQYGFKPRPFNPDLPARRPGLSTASASSRLPPGLSGPSSPGDPPALWLALSASRPRVEQVTASAHGSFAPRGFAPPASTLLRPDPRISAPPPDCPVGLVLPRPFPPPPPPPSP